MFGKPYHRANVPLSSFAARLPIGKLILAVILLTMMMNRQAGAVAAEKTKLSVFAAASLGDVLKTAAQDFETLHPDIEVSFNLAGSQQLAQQLADGAPADLFAAADDRQMQKAITAGRVNAASVALFAGNRLIVIVPEDNPAGITALTDLRRPGINILLADENVPAGRYSRALLAKIDSIGIFGDDYGAAVLQNVASFEENVKAVASKVMLDDADAGIVYRTDAMPGSRIGTINIPDSLNIVTHYPIGIIKDSAHNAAAKSFIDYLLAPAGQAIILKAGFLPPPSVAPVPAKTKRK